MRVAIASGKGGTGKTTVVSSLVNIWRRSLIAVDLDVEEPNLHLFLKPKIVKSYTSFLRIPIVNKKKCQYCKKCSDFCQFSAISVFKNDILIFSEMCHGCNGCIILCPAKAMTYGKRELGDILFGKTENADFIMGKLRVGEAMSPPLMKEINKYLSRVYNSNICDIIVDSPPGASCPAVNSVLYSDLILLVTEPTPFGLYDLEIAYKAFLKLNIPMAVIINKFGIGNDDVINFCQDKQIRILTKIPFDLEFMRLYSKGDLISLENLSIKKIFLDLYNKIQNFNRN